MGHGMSISHLRANAGATKSNINVHWKTGHDWLVFDYARDTMTCSVCVEFAKINQSNQKSNLVHQYTFITGCTNLRVSAVINHETIKGHLKAVAALNDKISSHADKMESIAGKTLMSQICQAL